MTCGEILPDGKDIGLEGTIRHGCTVQVKVEIFGSLSELIKH